MEKRNKALQHTFPGQIAPDHPFSDATFPSKNLPRGNTAGLFYGNS